MVSNIPLSNKSEMHLVLTEDGSHTLLNSVIQEHYHSIHGAVQESRHVFILNGFSASDPNLNPINILEIGFGTGLNAYLTLLESKHYNRAIVYHTIEAYPIDEAITKQLNFPQLLLNKSKDEDLDLLHTCAWDTEIKLNSNFIFQKFKGFFQEIKLNQKYDLVYFDAFSPNVQPELWTEEIFSKIFSMLNEKGFLVSYCAKGEVKRNLKKAGFTVVGKPGPPGKREMTVAYR